MDEVLAAKFSQHEELKWKLIETGNATIIMARNYFEMRMDHCLIVHRRLRTELASRRLLGKWPRWEREQRAWKSADAIADSPSGWRSPV